jgi:hypothetical protein
MVLFLAAIWGFLAPNMLYSPVYRYGATGETGSAKEASPLLKLRFLGLDFEIGALRSY